MVYRKILLAASIIYSVLAVIALVAGLWMFISSRQIPYEDDMYGESRGWGQIIGLLVFIIGFFWAVIGVLGLVFNKKRYGAIYYIVAGAIFISLQITSIADIIGALNLVLPMTYLVCGILLFIHNSKIQKLAASQNAAYQDNALDI